MKDIGHHVLPDRLSEPKRPTPKRPVADTDLNRVAVPSPLPIRHHVRQVPFNKRGTTRIGGPYHWVIVLFGSVALVCTFLFVLSFFLPDDDEEAGSTADVASDYERVRYFDGAVKIDIRSEWVAGTVRSDVHTEFLLATSDNTWDEAAIADDYLLALAELPAGEAFIAVQVYGYEFGLEMQREVAAYPPSYMEGGQYVAEVRELTGYVVDEWRYDGMVVQEAFVPFHSWAVANVMLYSRAEDAADLRDEFEEVLRSISIKMSLAERPEILLDWEDWGLPEGGDLGVPDGSSI